MKSKLLFLGVLASLTGCADTTSSGKSTDDVNAILDETDSATAASKTDSAHFPTYEGEIAINSTANAEVNMTVHYLAWSFRATENQRLTLSGSGETPDVDTIMAIYKADSDGHPVGRRLAWADDISESDRGSQIDYTFAKAGQYAAVLRLYNMKDWKDSHGDARELTLYVHGAADNAKSPDISTRLLQMDAALHTVAYQGELAIGDIGNVDASETLQYASWSFTAKAGEPIVVYGSGEFPGFDTVLGIYHADETGRPIGDRIADADDISDVDLGSVVSQTFEAGRYAAVLSFYDPTKWRDSYDDPKELTLYVHAPNQ